MNTLLKYALPTLFYLLIALDANSQQQLITYNNATINQITQSNQFINNMLQNFYFEAAYSIDIQSLEHSLENSIVSIDLPNYSCSPSFIFKNSIFTDKDNYIWYAEANTKSTTNCINEGSILLIKENGSYFGSISSNDDHYVIRNFDGNHFLLKSPNESNEEEMDCKTPNTSTLEQINFEQINTQRGVQCPGQNLVSVLFLYTDEALQEVSFRYIEQTAKYGIASLQIAAANSHLSADDVDFEIVGITEFPEFTESDDMERDMEQLSFPDGFGDNQRFLNEADIVVLIVSGNRYQNRRYGRTRNTSLRFEDAYCIVTLKNIGRRLTIPHEIAHTFNGNHADWFPPEIFNRGFVFKSGKWPFRKRSKTISAQLDRGTKKRIHYFSNPAIQYNGASTGTAENNMSRYLDETAAFIVANHFPNETSFYKVSLEGPWSACPCYSTRYWANVTCATPPVALQWETSSDGVHWTNRGNGEFFDYVPPCNVRSLTSIRLTVRDGSGRTEVRQKTVGASPGGSACSSIRKIDEHEITATVIPNPINSTSKLYLDFDSNKLMGEKLTIVVLDIHGKPVYSRSAIVTDKRQEIPLVGFTPRNSGMYYFTIVHNKQVIQSIPIKLN